MFVRRVLHRMFPRRFCSRDAPLVFVDNSIYCPVCKRLLAYRYLSTGTHQRVYDVHVCFPEAFDTLEALDAANRFVPTDDDPYGLEATIRKLHEPPYDEPMDEIALFEEDERIDEEDERHDAATGE